MIVIIVIVIIIIVIIVIIIPCPRPPPHGGTWQIQQKERQHLVQGLQADLPCPMVGEGEDDGDCFEDIFWRL